MDLTLERFWFRKTPCFRTFDFEGLSNISIASGALFCLSPETWRPTILMVLNGTILKSPTEEDPTPTGKQEDSNTPQAPRILGSGQNMQILPVIIILSTYINYMASKRSTQRILGIRCGGDCLTDLEMNSKYGEFFPISISTKKLWKKKWNPSIYTIDNPLQSLGIQSPPENGNETQMLCISEVIEHPNHYRRI